MMNNGMTLPSHPQNGWNTFIGLPNPIYKMTLSAVGMFGKARMRYFDTPQEAVDFLQSIDDTLPDLSTQKASFAEFAQR